MQVAISNEGLCYSMITEKQQKKTLSLSDFWCTLSVHRIVIFVAMKLCYYQLLLIADKGYEKIYERSGGTSAYKDEKPLL